MQAPPAETPAALPLDEIWAQDKPDEIDFVLPGLALGTVGNMVSAGGTGKTFAMLQTVMGVGIGRDVGGLWGEDPVQGHAVFLSLEDPDQVLRVRLHAIKHLLSDDERERASKTVRILPGAGVDGLQIPKGGQQQAASDWFVGFRDHLAREPRPRLVVIDTLNRALGGLSENDSGPMGWVLKQVEVLAKRANAAVVMCHHVSKAALANRSDDEAHAARGSSALTDNARWQANMSVLPKDDARAKGMTSEERRRNVRLEITKSNYGPPRGERWLSRQAGGILRHSPDGPPEPSAAPSGGHGQGAGRGKPNGFSSPSPRRKL